MGMIIVYPFLSLLLTSRFGFSDTEASFIVVIASAISIVGSIIGGKLADAWSRKYVFLIAAACVCVVMTLAGFFVDSMRGYRVLEENGFDQLPAGGNFNGVVEYCYDSMRLTVENCSKIIAPERLKGFMMTNWEKTNAERKPRLVEAVNALTDGYNAYYNK